jgi:predicted RNase H-like nuclease (RuvC/YqgF family)
MNNRIHELQQNLIEIQQRIEKIQKEIETYQKISTEHLTEIGAIRMYENLSKYSIRNIYFLEQLNQCLI